MSVIGPRSNWPFCIVMTPALSSIPEPARISALLAASTRYFDGPCGHLGDALRRVVDVDHRACGPCRAGGRTSSRASASGPTSAWLGPRSTPRSSPRAFAAIAPSSRDAARPGRGRRRSAACSRVVDASIASTPTPDDLRGRRAGERVDRPDLAARRPARTMNGLRKNESPASAAWSNSALRGLACRSRPLPRISCGRAEVVLGGLELVEARLRVPAGLDQLERGHRATRPRRPRRRRAMISRRRVRRRAAAARSVGAVGAAPGIRHGQSILRAGGPRFRPRLLYRRPGRRRRRSP